MAGQSTDTVTSTDSRSLLCGERLLSLQAPQIMGVLNVTPDSFSDGGALHRDGCVVLDKVLVRVEQMLAQGASIIDVGGESTRPGATPVSLEQESDRVLPVVEAINQRFETIISVDTSSPELMTAVAQVGAGLLNDVRALQRPGAINAAAATGLPVCLMHMKGQPQTMQQQPIYTDVVAEVRAYLQQRVSACNQGGIDSARILLDPGFGFGKTLEHNLLLLNRLSELSQLGFPLLVGLSRKSLIAKIIGRELDQRLAGSIALAMMAAQRGAAIIRVHDVAETADAIKLLAAVDNA
ncbi:MAG: dihydropteroate synthase [Oceanicoccus sp.]|jgi:dihydropteroate synthase